MNDNPLALPWRRETVGHATVDEIAVKNYRDLKVPLDDGTPPNTDATWIINADNKIVAFIGNGPKQTRNAELIIEAVEEYVARRNGLDRSLDGSAFGKVFGEVMLKNPHFDVVVVNEVLKAVRDILR